MAEDKYSIDDILAEIDRKRSTSDSPREAYDGSVTDIINGNEIDEALRSAKASKKQRQTDASDEQLTARQRTEEEVEQRRSEEISAAAEKSSAEKAERLRRQQSERDSESKRKKEVAKKEPAPKKKTPTPTEETGFTAELSSPRDAAKLFGSDDDVQEPESEHVQPFVKPEVAGADEDIVFHTRSDLVTTNTQQIRKQQRIEEINAALLRVDSGAESPDELMDSLNPMDSRARAAEDLKTSEQEDDTLAIAGNEIKQLAGKEDVKEYSPVISRRKSKADDVLFTPTAKQKKKPEKEERTPTAELMTDILRKEREKSVPVIDMPPSEDTIESDLVTEYRRKPIPTAEVPEVPSPTEEDEELEKVRRANELAARKQRGIKDFILEDIEDDMDTDDDEEDDDDELEEEIDLDDENVIAERLDRACKGLIGRLVILGILTVAALFIGLTNQFNADWGFITNIISKVANPEYFLAAYLTIGILSFVACSSVITSGFEKIIRLRPDTDTLCAMSHVAAIIAIIPYLALQEYIQRGRAHVYLIVSLTALIFNTISKLFTVYSAKRNFKFTSSLKMKYFVQLSEDESADKLAKGAVTGLPVVASMRKTELLCDFIISTYCEEVSDRIARIATPVTFCIALVGGLIAYFTGESQYVLNNLSWASTVASAVFAIGATYSGSMIVTAPILSASKTLTEKNAAILGYNAVDNFSEVNALLVDSKTLFPASSVKINNMWDYHSHKNNGSQKIPLDQAIILAASLSVASDSVLSDAFFSMLKYKESLLKPVNNCVYESGLGVMGWIDRRRVLLGNREHMKSHEIMVPDKRKEDAANKDNDEVLYLAVGGEVCMLFFVRLTANSKVKRDVKRLAKHGVNLVVKTVDGMITGNLVTELFDLEPDSVKIIPFESHEQFNALTSYIPSGSAAVCCDGSFSAFAAAINGAKNLREKIAFGCTMQIAGMALGMLLALIFTIFTKYNMFNVFFLLIYNIVWLALTLGVQALKRV